MKLFFKKMDSVSSKLAQKRSYEYLTKDLYTNEGKHLHRYYYDKSSKELLKNEFFVSVNGKMKKNTLRKFYPSGDFVTIENYYPQTGNIKSILNLNHSAKMKYKANFDVSGEISNSIFLANGREYYSFYEKDKSVTKFFIKAAKTSKFKNLKINLLHKFLKKFNDVDDVKF